MNNQKNENTKKTKRKMEFSKKVTIAAVLLAYAFIMFVCYMMYKTENLEPISYIGAGIVVMLAICVKAYMKRAYQQDLVDLEVEKAKQLSELKTTYGDDFVHDDIEDVTIDGT